MLLRSPSKNRDFDPPAVTHGAPMDLDGKDPSDEENDGSEYDMAPAEVEQNLIQLDSDDEPTNTTGTHVPYFPSVPSPFIPLTQARGSTRTVTRQPLGSTSSTTTIPPTQTRSSAGSNIPHPLAPIFPMSSTQTRSSTGTHTSRPLARPLGPPTYTTIAAAPQAEGSAPSSHQLSPGARGITPWQMGLLTPDPRGRPPAYTPSVQLCVVRNS
jgi:hypothetical protein